MKGLGFELRIEGLRLGQDAHCWLEQDPPRFGHDQQNAPEGACCTAILTTLCMACQRAAYAHARYIFQSSPMQHPKQVIQSLQGP